MLYVAKVAVCSQINTKHVNTVWGQNLELLNVRLLVHHVASRLLEVKPVGASRNQ